MLTHAPSAVIEADYRMPKSTEEDREGYCLSRMVPRHLTQSDNRAHATSPIAAVVHRRTGGADQEYISSKCGLLHAARL
jgi:hypothetical protein